MIKVEKKKYSHQNHQYKEELSSKRLLRRWEIFRILKLSMLSLIKERES